MSRLSPFELDILEQPAALRRALAAPMPADLPALLHRPWERVVFTGMGSSDYAALPTWRAAVAAGWPAWHLDAGQLLDASGLLTAQTLVIATSQSGASGEIVELLERRRQGRAGWGGLIGISDVQTSPLALAADLSLPLHSGPEATVSTKSYLNTLVIHRQLAAAIRREDPDHTELELHSAAQTVTDLIGAGLIGAGLIGAGLIGAGLIGGLNLSELAQAALEPPGFRLVSIGKADDAATALYASLIIKEAAKVATEGYVGGQFRHGPMELAGPGLSALIFGGRRTAPDAGLRRLAADIAATGARTVLIGDEQVNGARALSVPCATTMESLLSGALVAQSLAVELAKANGVVPGAFIYGNKVTSAL